MLRVLKNIRQKKLHRLRKLFFFLIVRETNKQKTHQKTNKQKTNTHKKPIQNLGVYDIMIF